MKIPNAMITSESVTAAAFKGRADSMAAIDELDSGKAQTLLALMETTFPRIKLVADVHYSDAVRATDTNGAKARLLSKSMVPLTARTAADMKKWETAISHLQI